MRKNRATRLANRVGSITELRKLLVPLVAAAKKAEGRDKLPTRRKVETHEAAIAILQSRKAEAPAKKTPSKAAASMIADGTIGFQDAALAKKPAKKALAKKATA